MSIRPLLHSSAIAIAKGFVATSPRGAVNGVASSDGVMQLVHVEKCAVVGGSSKWRCVSFVDLKFAFYDLAV